VVNNLRKQIRQVVQANDDERFLILIHDFEKLIAKVLSLALIVVIFVSVIDLVRILGQDILTEPRGFFNRAIFEIFGLFLNVLIALELLENVTAYLRKHVIQVELVIITALIAVARKLIIFDFSKSSSIDLVGLAAAILALATSYWIVRRVFSRTH
jgi:uncharacterized membrane protein (DUF373 family)